jgi:hypothetical protein
LLWLSDLYVQAKPAAKESKETNKRHHLTKSTTPRSSAGSADPTPTNSPVSKRRKSIKTKLSSDSLHSSPSPPQSPVSAEEVEPTVTFLQRCAITIADWTSEQVEDWLEDVGLQLYCTSFRENDITGADLLDLDEADFEDLGITKGHRKKFKTALSDLLTFQNSLRQ